DGPDGADRADDPDDADDARASVGELARAAAEELRAQGRSEVTLALDDTLFTGPAYAPGWGGIDFDYVMAIQPIAIDSGRLASGGYAEDPALAAARAFASHLEAAGISVTGDITRDSASPDAEPIAEVTSAPLSDLVRHTLRESDNSTSEVLARLVALAEGEEPSFAGAARAVRSRLASMGLDVAGLELPDTSGLLVEVQATPGLLSDALLLGLEDPNFRAVIDGLPVAALNGTLRHRLDGPAAGVARAKTGTLTTAVSLSGIVLTADGRPLVFAVLADGVEFGGAAAGRAAIDEWVHHLATCGCR
ncbi:MAG TPA: D-alanyl-D-alanine carboxypeptidase/D-alanyl-D-alanine-endopeptidase, partial [Actinomycetaceae bacterium]|nr:D-alanyl-D-alanine carboxypeptidase/D-alanyl-D-alanine-endopeptidase [Actinomycetaceae bacterium]